MSSRDIRGTYRFNSLARFTGTGTITLGVAPYAAGVVVKKAIGAATAVTLPSNPLLGQCVIVKDGSGDAATNNITLTPASGTIDGAATYVISANYGYVTLEYNGTEWGAIGGGATSSGGGSSTGNLTVTGNLTQATGTVSMTPTKTVTSATSATLNAVTVPATTITVTGTTQVTTAGGFNFVAIAVPTYTDASAVTIDRGATVYIAGPPTAGGSVTLTAPYALWIDSGVTRLDGNIDFAAAAADLIAKSNTAAALRITDGTTAIVSVDSRNTIANVNNVTITGAAPTITSAAAVHQNASLYVAIKTITYTGTNTVTSSLGAQLYLDIPTFTDASAGTISVVSTLHVAAVATAGGSLTLTARRMISTGVSDCFLTNAGVWTDTACWAYGKDAILNAGFDAVERLVAKLTPRSWTYRQDVHGDDRGRERVGIVYDELPDELTAPGEERGVSAGLLSSFALAAIRVLFDENRALKERLAKLESA